MFSFAFPEQFERSGFGINPTREKSTHILILTKRRRGGYSFFPISVWLSSSLCGWKRHECSDANVTIPASTYWYERLLSSCLYTIHICVWFLFLYIAWLLCSALTALDLFVSPCTISYACCYFRHCRISLALRENTIHGRLKKMAHGFSFNKPSKVVGWIRCTIKWNIDFWYTYQI